MFGAEPQERLTKEERRDFDNYASDRIRQSVRAAIRVGALFLANILLIVPFAAGQPLHRYWYSTRFLVWIAMALWVWLVIRVAGIWGAWQAARQTRRQFRESDDGAARD